MNDRTVYRAFKDAAAYMDDIYSLYESIYSLPKFTNREIMTDRDLFNYCKDRRYFANILPYTRNLQALLSPAFDESSLSWRIIGGGVPDSFESNFITVAQRHI
ncbi:MAG: hypothetical protein Q7J32_02480, partial [Sphingomonadaceae bacterium]|nr:hypothetical protein [Sphingomonadaceae bacterium]